MNTILQPDDHYVLRKLCDEVLPWMICGRRVGRQWFVLLSRFYSYASDLAAAPAGLGIGAPLVAIVQGSTQQDQNALHILKEVLPSDWFYVGLIALIVWVVLKHVVQREDVIARGVQARDFSRAISGLYVQLERALAESDPMPQITSVQRSIDERIQDAIKNGVWPWDPPRPPLALIEAELIETVGRYRVAYMGKWNPVPPGVI